MIKIPLKMVRKIVLKTFTESDTGQVVIPYNSKSYTLDEKNDIVILTEIETGKVEEVNAKQFWKTIQKGLVGIKK